MKTSILKNPIILEAMYSNLPSGLEDAAWDFDRKYLTLTDEYVDAHQALCKLLMKAYQLGKENK